MLSFLTRQGHGLTVRFDVGRRLVACCLQGKGMTASESVTLDKHALPLYQVPPLLHVKPFVLSQAQCPWRLNSGSW